MNIFITGAAGGIGAATAKKLAADENIRVLATSRNLAALKQMQNEAEFSNIEILQFDFERDDFKKIEDFAESVGRIDVLINNAGFLIKKPFDELSRDDWLKSFEINLLAPIIIVKSLIRFMGGEKASHIVNISSMSGYQGGKKFPGMSAYGASKAALVNLTECLAEEFEEKNVFANCVALGSVDTEMFGEAFPGAKASMSPDEASEFLAHFALNAHKYMNGKTIPLSKSAP